MFTAAALICGCLIAWGVSRRQYADTDNVGENIKFTRQDLRLVAYLLFAILIALGVIADRLH
jgi:nitrogen fixation-related uncharacterized protein